MQDVPRGLPDRFLNEQKLPQAQWQSEETLRHHPALAYNPEAPNGKILFGSYGKRLLGVRDNRHFGTVAGNRSGKSVLVLGNLLLYDGSVFVFDPKGELASRSARRRAQMGQSVYVLDPYNRVRGPARAFRAEYDPLSVLDLNNGMVIEQAMQMIDGMVMSTGEEKDPHWLETAGDVLLGFILYIRFGEGLKDEDRTLTSVRRLVRNAMEASFDEEGNKVYRLPQQIIRGVSHLLNTEHEDVARTIIGAVRGFYEKPSKEMGSVLSMMRRQTAFLEFRAMRDVLGRGTLDLRDLKREANGVTVYVCLPATRMGMCKRWLRILVNQLVDAMEFEVTEPSVPALAILDEFPILGHMKQLEDAIGQVASFGLRIWFILQDWSQGVTLYKERWESFTANAGVMQFFANTDPATTEHVSRRLGKTLIQSVRRNDTGHDDLERGRAGRSMGNELYDLLSPDEISRLFSRSDPHMRQLIIMAGLHPLICSRVEYWNDKHAYHHWFAGKFD
jgi:type IV secretion system protein VirD4